MIVVFISFTAVGQQGSGKGKLLAWRDKQKNEDPSWGVEGKVEEKAEGGRRQQQN